MTRDDLVPARMLNEWIYCPRLAWLEWQDREWADSADTVDGRFVHRRVDDEDKTELPGPDEMPVEGEVIARGVKLSAVSERLIAVIDLLEGRDGVVRPVDYKRGKVPDDGPWPPERVQVCAQVLVLRENGYRCDEAVLYFAGSKRRVVVPIDDALIAQTRAAVQEMLAAEATGARPGPLEDSPKCVRCSLAPICLPDELNALNSEQRAPGDLRRIHPARDDALPLHVVKQGAKIGKRGDELYIAYKGTTLAKARIPATSSVSLYGGVSITTPALKTLMDQGIPVGYFSRGGWFTGTARGMTTHGLELRRAQYRAADDDAQALTLAKRFVRVKLRNQRTLLRRNGQAPDEALRAMKAAWQALDDAQDLSGVLGCEGQGAAVYFQNFGGMLRAADFENFEWTRRSRRPPVDPVNATLSYCYALLTGICTSTLHRVGFDPLLGFLHQPRAGRPALALDFMEVFRPLLADSTTLMAINNGELTARHFIKRGPACALTSGGRRVILAAWERRLDGLVTHPVFGYRLSYRRILEVQARLLARHLLGELPEYPAFEVR